MQKVRIDYFHDGKKEWYVVSTFDSSNERWTEQNRYPVTQINHDEWVIPVDFINEVFGLIQTGYTLIDNR